MPHLSPCPQVEAGRGTILLEPKGKMNSRFDDNQPHAASQLGQAVARAGVSEILETKRTLASATGGFHTVTQGENLGFFCSLRFCILTLKDEKLLDHWYFIHPTCMSKF